MMLQPMRRPAAAPALRAGDLDAPAEAPPAAEAPRRAPLLVLSGVSKTFGAVRALDGLGVSIAPGEFVTVVGPSGCGKSTLFNIVSGLEEPDEGGAIEFLGKRCRARDLLGKVSFMPQRDLLLPWRTVIDNAILAMEIEGARRGDARRIALDMLGEFGLAGFEHQYPHQLSGGMRQRVALMRTFLFKRDLMLLDEPFGALDALTRTLMQRWLLDVWQKHRRTILFITHDVDEALFLGDRVLVMTARPGRVKLEQPVSLPRPRRPDIVTTPEFIALKRTLLDAIEEESLKTFTLAKKEDAA
ncbi:ABC transporter ATP-binding protein [Caldimonas thermodepolymerans]|jgi:ABC-type nitrate/sulfonate/bicarbonate transport system ATPase subunit|uniref:ABC-type nitrate/sulfonate/bicarbonate transport system ATPase subunit n=2 Tax=Caldimonas thermodepolymerans TaxID=215580 RepID=A0AA46HWD6_9BURK|nr:ABC transporter ATP-binding protein [Caldimonas thermodepolymerans]TCP08294.1 ABC-type nitrate/sulfonate/bicarbonate transport system ATPase subunit [Caldimonas thermodepolymerans]UZG48593.1 ABC transporter ATP-binding protein [Caldimonas thermodepolymerans]